MSSEFSKYHPTVNIIYFALVIIFAMFITEPLYIFISLLSSILLASVSGKNNLKFLLPVVIFTAIINPIFNHRGMTILWYFPSGNALTLESIVYGVFSSLALASVINYFSAFNFIVTSEKLIFIFGKIIPTLSLLLTMTLRMVPRFIKTVKTVASQNKTDKNKIKNAVKVLYTSVAYSMENSIETADSMKNRGYGLGKRSNFSYFSFKPRDLVAIIFMIVFAIVTLLLVTDFYYYPTFAKIDFNTKYILGIVSYFILCTTPIIIEITEKIRWNVIKSRI